MYKIECFCCTIKIHNIHCGMCHSHKNFNEFMAKGEPFHSGSVVGSKKGEK